MTEFKVYDFISYTLGEVPLQGMILQINTTPRGNSYNILLHENNAVIYSVHPSNIRLINSNILPELVDAHENHEVIDNEVLGKAFKYCRTCKDEVSTNIVK